MWGTRATDGGRRTRFYVSAGMGARGDPSSASEVCSDIQGSAEKLASSPSVEGEYALPIVLHADDGPVFLLRFIVKRLTERAHFGFRKPLCGPVRIFALRVVVHDQHHQPRAVASPCVFEHLSVAVRISKCRARPPTDHQMDAFRLPRIIVVQK